MYQMLAPVCAGIGFCATQRVDRRISKFAAQRCYLRGQDRRVHVVTNPGERGSSDAMHDGPGRRRYWYSSGEWVLNRGQVFLFDTCSEPARGPKSRPITHGAQIVTDVPAS